MGNSSGNQNPSILSMLLNLLNLFKPAPAPTPTPVQPVLPPDNTTEPARIVTSRVLLVIYDPIMNPTTGAKLSQVMQWQRPDDLANGFIQDVLEVSGGLARYQIVQRIELNEFPAKVDGYRYDPQTYMAVMNKTRPAYQPERADYKAILTGLNILPRITNREIDEVWIFNFPNAGFFESTMCGAGAFWCNSDPQTWSSGCSRRFVVMGFSYERGVGEMLHDLGHRAESILGQVFHCQDFVDWANKQNRTPATVGPKLNLFERFLCFDQIAPGKAALGTIHYPPNGTSAYDYNNSRKVSSSCYDWLSFPAFQNDVRQVGPEEWGNGDMRLLHKWWLKHLPKVAGRTAGVVNNWWQYIIDPNLVIL
jgi:hypothetical protein